MTRAICFGVAAAVLVLVAPTRAAAQSPPSATTVRMRDGDAMLHAFRSQVLLDTLAIWQDVPGSPARVYTRVKQILEALKVPYTQTDSTHGMIWNEGFVTRGGLAGSPKSRSLRCGFGPTGDHADSWRVSVAYAVYIKPSHGGGSRLGIAVMGQAKDNAGSSTPGVFCASQGRLESEIVRLVRDSS